MIVLNKSDLSDELESTMAAVEAVAFRVPVHPVSCLDDVGLEGLEQYLAGNQTAALLGSSGVGKSSLLNRLLGWDRQEVGSVEARRREGPPPTTHRELVPLPSGGLVLDTPGMRELGLWGAEAGVDEAFSDIAELAARCRFNDCGHETEPGCAVRAAIADEQVDEERLESYREAPARVATPGAEDRPAGPGRGARARAAASSAR